MYRVENAAGLQACALAARLCSDKDLELGAESCERTSETSDQDSCVIDEACGKPIDLGATSDAHAWLMRVGSARCNRSNSLQAFGCSCLNGLLKSDYDLLANSGKLACGPFVDFCMSGATPTFDGKEACVPIYSDSGSEGCEITESCAATLPLTGGVSLAHLKQRYANCVANPGGGSECRCEGQDNTAFSFQLSTPPNDASCESSIPNCDPAAVIKATGVATCEPQSLDTGDDDLCETYLSCVQGATVDNRNIVAEGRLALICRRAETGMPWVCSCASDQKTAKVDLGAAGANATQACTEASAVCLERLGLHLGPAGDAMAPPDPFLY